MTRVPSGARRRRSRLRPAGAASGQGRGNAAERRAVWHYRLRGYRILGTNVWAGRNEIDVIARRGSSLVFCEVKEKSGPGFGDPLEMIGPEKARRVRHAAEAWLATHPELAGLEVRFDAVAERAGRLERLSNAF